MLDIAATLLVLTALLMYLNARWLKLPTTIGLMVTSMLLSLALVGFDALGVAGAMHAREAALVGAIDFNELLMQGMLSLLLFAGALHVDVEALREYRWQVALLAFVGTAASTALVGAALWGVLGLIGLAVPLLDCLLFGALISPTDPIAVIGMLKSAGAPRNLETVIAGESLFNDGVGVVIFTLLLGMRLDGAAPTLGHAGALLLQEAGGGLVFGWVLGRATLFLLRSIDNYQVEVVLTLAAVVGGYALANSLHCSGPLAMVVSGLVVGGAAHADKPGATSHQVHQFWELLDELLNAVLFVLVGMEVIVIRFPVSPALALFAGSATIVVALVARWLTVGLPVLAFRRAFRLPAGAAGILTWGGLRGGISLALALALPAGPHRETLIALTYCVVAFAILVQGLSFGRLVRRIAPN